MAINNNPPSNITWINSIRCIATLFVIVIHIVAPIVEKFNEIAPQYWYFANILDSLCRCAVPLFVMLSGALLLGKEEPLKLFLKKRVSKIIPPFLFWSFVYLSIAYASNFIFSTNSDKDFVDWVGAKLTKGTAYHLWYIYMILGLYLAIPFLNKIIKQIGKKEYYLFFAIWILTSLMAYPIFEKYFPNFDFTFFSGYIGYLLLGYFLSHFPLKFINKKLGIILIMIGWYMTSYFTYSYSASEGKYVETFYNYLSINVAFTTVGFFILFKNLKISNKAFLSLSNLISDYSFGIYLNHVLVITILYKLGLSWNFINPEIGSLFTFVAVLIISIIIVYISDQLKLRRLLG